MTEIGVARAGRRDLGAELLACIPARLVELITHDCLSPRERAEAGSVLSALGDPRDLDEMVPVPAGTFLMGSDKTKDELAYDDEVPQHTLTLPAYPHRQVPGDQRPVCGVRGGHRPSGAGSLARQPTAARIAQPSGRECQLARCGGLLRVAEPGPGPGDAPADRGRMGARRVAHRRPDLPVGQTISTRGRCNMATRASAARRRWASFRPGMPCAARPIWRATCGSGRAACGARVGKPEFGYPYDPNDGRENLNAPDSVWRALRGGSFGVTLGACAAPSVTGTVRTTGATTSVFGWCPPAFEISGLWNLWSLATSGTLRPEAPLSEGGLGERSVPPGLVVDGQAAEDQAENAGQ